MISTATLQNDTLEWILSPTGIVLWLYSSGTSHVLLCQPRLWEFSDDWQAPINTCLQFKCNSHLWCRRFRGVCHHLFVDFPRHAIIEWGHCGQRDFGKKFCDRLTWYFAHTQRATVRIIWPYIFLVSPKMGASLTVPFALRPHDCAQKVLCREPWTIHQSAY